MGEKDQLELLEFAESRPTGQVIDIIDRIALRIWYRRYWPKPKQPCLEIINLHDRRRGAA